MRLVLLLTLAALGTPLTGCGQEELAGVESMTLREMLGLDPERVAELSDGDHQAIIAALIDHWDEAVVDPPPPQRHAMEAAEHLELLELVRVHDGHRLERGLDVQLSARIDALDDEAGAVEVRATPLPRDLLGLEVVGQGDALRVTPLDLDEPHHGGELVADTHWGRVELDALEGRSELETLDVLAPALRRYLYQMGLTGETARLLRAPRAPLALWYDASRNALLINPVLLYLLNDDASGAPVAGRFVTDTRALTPDFIAACIDDQTDRCRICFGDAGDPTRSVCAPIFEPPDDIAPLDHARAECESLAAQPGDDGFGLLCYHIAIQANLACFLTADPDDRCGATSVPVSNVAGLAALDPMLTDAWCQGELQQCRDDRIVDPPPDVVVEDDGDEDDDDDDLSDAVDDASAFADCVGTFCEIFSAGSVCAGSDSEGGGGGGVCEGDGLDGADACCEGDGDDGGGEPSSAAASIFGLKRTRATEMLLTLPFLFLLTVYWRARGVTR